MRSRGPDGANPIGTLVADEHRNLYGTTSQGGQGKSSAGVVFKLAPPRTSHGLWQETILHTFTGLDGAHPYSGLIRDAKGNLYGTTNSGGAFDYGTVFKVDATGKETVLYSFRGFPDGAHPYGGVVRDHAGRLYGTTIEGGAFNLGSVFTIDLSSREVVLHNFLGTPDGAYPNGGLALDSRGNLYGAANEGGGADDEGTIFMLDNRGKFSVLRTFTGKAEGASPSATLALDAAGILYGTTTEGGGRDQNGLVFALDTTSGSFHLEHVFGGKGGGSYPQTGVVLDPNGNLYGAAVNGGTGGWGLVFKVTPH